MDFKIENVSGIGEYTFEDLIKKEKKEGKIFFAPNSKAFCVLHEGKTIEIRTDENLSKVLQEKYESVMQSRYFGRGGIEIVLSGQMAQDEIYDLVRLSYNMTVEN